MGVKGRGQTQETRRKSNLNTEQGSQRSLSGSAERMLGSLSRRSFREG